MSNRFMAIYAHSPTVKNEVFILDNMLGSHPDKCFVVMARALNSEFYEKLKMWAHDQEAQNVPTFFQYLQDKYFPNIRDKDALNVLHTKGFLATVNAKDVYLKVAGGEQMSIRQLNDMIMEKNPEIKAKAEEAIKAAAAQPTNVEQMAEQMAANTPVVQTNVETAPVVEQEAQPHAVDTNTQLLAAISALTEKVSSLQAEVEDMKSKPKRGRKPKADAPTQESTDSGETDSVFPSEE